MRILFITRRSSNCGVADYGKRLFSILKTGMDITVHESDSIDDLVSLDVSPYDTILYNYHHATLPYLSEALNRNRVSGIKHVALFHEAFQNIQPDTWISVSELPRPLMLVNELSYAEREFRENPHWWNFKIKIGSFGFGFPDKNYVGIAKMVRREFSRAILRLHIPFAEFGDEIGDMAKDRVQECRNELQGSLIELEVKHGFMPTSELITWLSENDLNIFNCIPTHGRGISSSIDYALSARRPIGISNSEMYRHLPREICLDNISLPRLIAQGIEPLKNVYEENSNEKLVEQMKAWLEK